MENQTEVVWMSGFAVHNGIWFEGSVRYKAIFKCQQFIFYVFIIIFQPFFLAYKTLGSDPLMLFKFPQIKIDYKRGNSWAHRTIHVVQENLLLYEIGSFQTDCN